jgi:hypothetical protein
MQLANGRSFVRVDNRFQNCYPRCPEARGILQIFEGNTELKIAESGNTVSDECEAIVVKLSGLNYLINGSVRYLFWPRGLCENNW